MHRLAVGALAGFAALAGCALEAKVKLCENGATCAADLKCTNVEPITSDAVLCGIPRLVDACTGIEQFTECDFTNPGTQDGTCFRNICTECTSIELSGCHKSGWQKMTTDVTVTLTTVTAPTASRAFAGGEMRTFLRYNGTGWQSSQVDVPGLQPDAAFAGVWASDPARVFAVMKSGEVLELANDTWTQVSSGGTFMRGISGFGTTVIAVGLAGTVVRYDGSSWILEKVNPLATLNGVWVTDANNAIAVAAQGAIYRFKNGTWSLDRAAQPTPPPGEPNLNTVWSSGTFGFAAGTHLPVQLAPSQPANVLRDDGAWTRFVPAFSEIPVQVDLVGAWGLGNTAFLVGCLPGCSTGWIGRVDGMSWRTSPPNLSPLTAIAGSAIDNIFAVGLNGAVVRYTTAQ